MRYFRNATKSTAETESAKPALFHISDGGIFMMDEKKKDNYNLPEEIEEILDELLDGETEEEASDIQDEKIALPMIPLRGLNIFPNMVLHFDVGREKSVKALEMAMVTDQRLFLVSQKDEDVEYQKSSRCLNCREILSEFWLRVYTERR